MKRILLSALLAVMTAVSAASGEGAPEWADVTLNEHGFLDVGEYLLEDPENGHWMYVNGTLRVQIVRTWETPEKARKGDAEQKFNCFTAEIWCDTDRGELPVTLWADPTRPGYTGQSRTVAEIPVRSPYSTRAPLRALFMSTHSLYRLLRVHLPSSEQV